MLTIAGNPHNPLNLSKSCSDSSWTVDNLSIPTARSASVGLFWLICFSLSAALMSSATDVVTYHNDIRRSGQNLQEKILNTSNVNSATFGKLFALPVDGIIDA